MIKVALAEDNPALLKTMTEMLQRFDGVELIFHGRNGKEIIHQCAKSKELPELILMDIEMPIMDGIAATARIKDLFPEVKVMMLTIFDQDDKIFDAIMAGACGYMLKGERPERILRAIEDAVEGRMPMSPEVAQKALEVLRGNPMESKPAAEDFGLTEREIEILQLLAAADTYKQIAEKLFISEKTVRNHIHNLYKKIHVSSRAEAMQLALKHKWD